MNTVDGGVSDLAAILASGVEQRTESMIAFRRALHATPEVSGEEVLTTARVRDALVALGLSPRVYEGEIGVTVDVDLGGRGYVALRSELDCVDVKDEKTCDYAARTDTGIHGCGHDAHTAMVLAATAVIHEHREQITQLKPKHNLRAVFQPAEETGVGASSMMRQGAVRDVVGMFAVHVEPFMEVGTVGLRRGPMTAACQSFEIHVQGKGGHTARPHEAHDPIPAATNLVGLLYQLAPRSMDSRYALALSVASINAGSSFNALPSEATVRGTLRTARLGDMEQVKEAMRDLCHGVSRAMGVEVELRFGPYLPPTNNDADLIDVFEQSAETMIGPGSVQWLEVPSLGGEDFAFYQQELPGAIVRLGSALPEREQRRPLHSPVFDIDERCLPLGAKVLAHAAVSRAVL